MAQDQLNKKLVNLFFLLAALVVAYVSMVFLEILAGFFVSFMKFYDKDMVRRGVPVLMGLVSFAIFIGMPKLRVWAELVIIEVRKVVWLTRNELTMMTIACLVMLIIAGVFLGGVDFVASRVVRLLLG